MMNNDLQSVLMGRLKRPGAGAPMGGSPLAGIGAPMSTNMPVDAPPGADWVPPATSGPVDGPQYGDMKPGGGIVGGGFTGGKSGVLTNIGAPMGGGMIGAPMMGKPEHSIPQNPQRHLDTPMDGSLPNVLMSKLLSEGEREISATPGPWHKMGRF